MSEQDNEVEALLGEFYEASKKEFSGDAVKAGVEAVIDAVRASDAARGGTLSAGQIEAVFRTYLLAEEAGRKVMPHMAAQGRTIAALQQEVLGWRAMCTEAQRERDALQQQLDDAKRFHTDEFKNRREMEAQVAALQQRAEQAERALDKDRDLVRKLGLKLAEKVEAKSDLATLRQAAVKVLAHLWDREHPFQDGDLGIEDTTGVNNAMLALEDAVDATPTPAEHPDTATDREQEARVLGAAIQAHAALERLGLPDTSAPDFDAKVEALRDDTATLRRIRERAKNAPALTRIWEESGRDSRALIQFVVDGDSGPSGGPGGPPLYRCSNCGEPRVDHPTAECKTWESSGSTVVGPSGGGETMIQDDAPGHACGEDGTECPTCQRPGEPMGHPNAGDSPAEVNTPAEADDWAKVEDFVSGCWSGKAGPTQDEVDDAGASLARLKQAHDKRIGEQAAYNLESMRMAAEAMRERCAQVADDEGVHFVAGRIRAVPLKPT